MTGTNSINLQKFIRPLAVALALLFLYYSVLIKLGKDWWTDENYSHGLLVPFVIAFIFWNERDRFREISGSSSTFLGSLMVAIALAMLAAGTLGAELFTQRISLVLMLAGAAVYFFGKQIFSLIALPAALLLLAIPIPQIVFNRIAFPLQIWASQMAVWGIRLFEVPTVRKGNVIDILPRGSTQTISLEVVEACSGIRSLMTLVTLALILAYFTRRSRSSDISGFSTADLYRAVILMAAAVPIAVLTNAARVTATGILTYYYGKQATDATLHDASGWVVYAVALGLLILANYVLLKVFRSRDDFGRSGRRPYQMFGRRASVMPLVFALVIGGIAVNWFVTRGEADIPRRVLSELPKILGEWQQKGEEIKFGPDVESVLRTTDYTMREYTLPDGRIANIYVGYYATQRTGATYHSPQNCLPGAGWMLSEPQRIEIEAPDGRTFEANRYIIKNGIYNEVIIYWYQGRGRSTASEYDDKINTIWDSVTRRRTDGSIVRVMTSVAEDETAAVIAAADLSSHLASTLTPFVPE